MDNYERKVQVLRNYDGDTVTVNIDLGFSCMLKSQTVRLGDIDTPELRGENRAGAILARDRLNELLREAGDGLTMRTKKSGKKGKWGRWIAWFYDGGICLNEVMLAEGHAVEYEGT